MERTKKILERFPDFYQTWDEKSSIYNLVSAVGKRIDEAEKEIDAILRSHWIDKANRDDLDGFGALFNLARKPGETDSDYRLRLKRAIIEFKGGGTKSAILTSVRMALGLPSDYPIELVENPQREKEREFKVKPGETWSFSSESVFDAIPDVEISIDSEGERITDPTIVNTERGESLTYNGSISVGETLTVKEGEARLERSSVKSKMSAPRPPTLQRKTTTWGYRAPISGEIGVFDTSAFNETKFAVGIPTTRLVFRWMAHEPAAFEIRLPREVLSKDGDVVRVQEAVNAIKASGVTATIKLIEED